METVAEFQGHVFDLFRLDGRVALVTGGSKGLGKSMALGLAQAGAITVLCSRHLEECQAAARQITLQTGRESIGLAANVTLEEEVKSLMDEVVRRFGRLDILINCAGVNIRRPIEQLSTEEFDQVMETNVKGTWLCCRAASPIMTRQRKGSVINIGSALSVVGLAERSSYCASKAAILGLTRTLALEWAPYGVRCNAICPGPFLTEINKPLLSDPVKVQAVIGKTAFNRWGQLYEIRGAALFLASDASSYVTGTALYVDGGWTAA